MLNVHNQIAELLLNLQDAQTRGIEGGELVKKLAQNIKPPIAAFYFEVRRDEMKTSDKQGAVHKIHL